MNQHPKTTQRLEGLDSLRGLAALGVMAYHYAEDRNYYGMLGVELFFVISGFVILMSLEKVKSLCEFALHRAARLYPAYWFSVAVVGTATLCQSQFDLVTLVINVTMLQGFMHVDNLIDPYWTLTYELWFYVVMAIVFAIGHIRNVDRIAVAWFFLMIAVHGALSIGHGWYVYNHWLFKLLFMPQFGHLFIAGMMIYRVNTGRGSPTTILVLGLALLYSLFGRPDWAAIPPLIYFPVNAVFIALVWAASSGRTFGLSILASIGVVSYSLYLLHVPIMLMVPHDTWKGIAISLTITFFVSAFSRRYIERPVLTWTKSLENGKLGAFGGSNS